MPRLYSVRPVHCTILAGALAAFGAIWSCDTANTPATPGSTSTGLTNEPVEWVQYHTEVPVQPSDFATLISGLIGPAAQGGQYIPEQQIAAGVYIKGAGDPTTPQQSRLTLTLLQEDGTRRTLALTPASFAIGSVFLTTVNAAVAQMQADVASQNAGGEEFLLQYQVTSTQGGTLSLGLHGNQGVYTTVLDITTPQTSLVPSQIGQPASNAPPYDAVAGTVYFKSMTKDDFDFFVDRAYGTGATSGQNFNNFTLVPYNWLHLTVTPHLSQKFVNVAFDVIPQSGSPIPIASAPASLYAGTAFQNTVDASMAQMMAQEQQKAGSSTPFTIPFYYNNPQGGGVVQVIVQGALGQYTVAYAVQSPQHGLTDVPFLAYPPVNITPPPDGSTGPACSTPALKGVFDITFIPSQVILDDVKAGNPKTLTGTIQCSIFYASDVTVAGPNPGAMSLQDFQVPNANLLATPPPTFTSNVLTAGNYQILCGQDLKGTGQIGMGDPVTLPIGAYTLGCETNPVTVEFALLDPEN